MRGTDRARILGRAIEGPKAWAGKSCFLHPHIFDRLLLLGILHQAILYSNINVILCKKGIIIHDPTRELVQVTLLFSIMLDFIM